LGAVIAAIHGVSADKDVRFWSFIRYISVNHPSILGVELKPEMQEKCDAVLQQAQIPNVTLRPSPKEEWEARRKKGSKKRWWEFWKGSTT